MKLAIIFEVPDDGDYADVAARVIQSHTFAVEKTKIGHWSFDVEMRPVAAFAGDDLAAIHRAIELHHNGHYGVPTCGYPCVRTNGHTGPCSMDPADAPAPQHKGHYGVPADCTCVPVLDMETAKPLHAYTCPQHHSADYVVPIPED